MKEGWYEEQESKRRNIHKAIFVLLLVSVFTVVLKNTLTYFVAGIIIGLCLISIAVLLAWLGKIIVEVGDQLTDDFWQVFLNLPSGAEKSFVNDSRIVMVGFRQRMAENEKAFVVVHQNDYHVKLKRK